MLGYRSERHPGWRLGLSISRIASAAFFNDYFSLTNHTVVSNSIIVHLDNRVLLYVRRLIGELQRARLSSRTAIVLWYVPLILSTVLTTAIVALEALGSRGANSRY